MRFIVEVLANYTGDAVDSQAIGSLLGTASIAKPAEENQLSFDLSIEAKTAEEAIDEALGSVLAAAEAAGAELVPGSLQLQTSQDVTVPGGPRRWKVTGRRLVPLHRVEDSSTPGGMLRGQSVVHVMPPKDTIVPGSTRREPD
jgi:hypothetical protein